MITKQLKRFMLMLLLVAVQVLVLNHVQFMGYGTPLLYVLLLIYLPMGTSRTSALLWGFSTGLIVDILSNTPGIASGAMTFAALIQPPLLNLIVPRDAPEDLVPSAQNMGNRIFIRYAMIVFFMHHLVYFTLACFSFYHIADAALYTITSWVTSMLLALAVEPFRKKK